MIFRVFEVKPIPTLLEFLHEFVQRTTRGGRDASLLTSSWKVLNFFVDAGSSLG